MRPARVKSSTVVTFQIVAQRLDFDQEPRRDKANMKPSDFLNLAKAALFM